MKNVLAVVGLSLTISGMAQATSLYYGSYLNLQKGAYSCTVLANSVTVFNDCKIVKTVAAKYNEAFLKKAIQAASKQTMARTGVHMIETKPHIILTAGVTVAGGAGEVKQFKLYEDGSDIQQRQGKDAADLIKQLNTACAAASK